MTIIHEPLRYAHEEGYTDVCYTSDGEYFITCGSDGDIRIWSVEEGSDPTHTCIGEWALSVRHKDDKLYVATGSNDIQILTHPEGDRDGVLTRATDPFNQIAICRNKNIAALAGEGMSVTIMDLDTSSLKTRFSKLGGPCLSVALCPKATKVAASTGDGKLQIWDLESRVLLKELSCFPKVNSFANAKVLCRIDFDPTTGINLAYPHQNTIKLLNTTSWEEKTLTCEKISADYSVLQYSNCGMYLAAATVSGNFAIWDISNLSVFKVTQHESSIAICALMWNPKGNGEIVYTDIEGQLSIMSNCSRLERVASHSSDHAVDMGVEDEAVQDPDDLVSSSAVEDARNSPELELQSLSGRSCSRASSRASTPRPRTPTVPLQPPFMPSSTPEHLDPRYLCYNHIGIVKCYGNNTDEEMSSKNIEVEFHDSSFHSSMMVPNFRDFTLGALGKGALAVANSNQLMVIPLAVNNKDWTLNVQEYEKIVLVSASEDLVCFATSNYLIRVCSIFGTQRGIVSVPGPLVSMASFCNVLLVAYHAGPVRENDQCINLKLFKFEGTNVESHDLGSALGPESTLFWVGFSDVGTPAMYDSLGMLSLFPPKCNTWIPFCDTTEHRKSPSDRFFITAVFESYQATGGVWCKGAIYPGFMPRPILCELPLQPPFAEPKTQKTQMEMSLFSWSNLAVSNVERNYKETALKLFALACKNDLDQRAFELMQLLSNQPVLNLALKYTSKLNKKRLSEKLMELASRLEEEDQEDEQPSKMFHSLTAGTPDASMVEDVVIKPKPTRLSLSQVTPRSKKLSKENSQPSQDGGSVSQTVNTQETLFSETDVDSTPLDKSETTLNESSNKSFTPTVNPFLKRPKQTGSSNPLSLTDKYAGINYEKTGNKQNMETVEKRKLSDSDTEKPAGKQRKLDKFMFSK